MSSEEFAVRIADLDAGPQRLQLPIRQEWLASALADVDAAPWSTQSAESAGEVDLEVTKNGRQILVRGTIKARVALPCARTLDPALYELEPSVFLMLNPAEGDTAAKQPGTSGGAARQRKQKGAWTEAPELSDEQAAEDVYSGEYLYLDPFIREFIVLEFPMFPLREDLRSDEVEASSALPSGAEATQLDRNRPLDPRLSPLAELKARLEKKE